MHRLKTNTTSTLQLNCTEMAELQWTPRYRVYLQLICAFGLPSCKPVVVFFFFLVSREREFVLLKSYIILLGYQYRIFNTFLYIICVVSYKHFQ